MLFTPYLPLIFHFCVNNKFTMLTEQPSHNAINNKNNTNKEMLSQHMSRLCRWIQLHEASQSVFLFFKARIPHNYLIVFQLTTNFLLPLTFLSQLLLFCQKQAILFCFISGHKKKSLEFTNTISIAGILVVYCYVLYPTTTLPTFFSAVCFLETFFF